MPKKILKHVIKKVVFNAKKTFITLHLYVNSSFPLQA